MVVEPNVMALSHFGTVRQSWANGNNSDASLLPDPIDSRRLMLRLRGR